MEPGVHHCRAQASSRSPPARARPAPPFPAPRTLRLPRAPPLPSSPSPVPESCTRPPWGPRRPHSRSSLNHWKSAGGTAMASQRRRAARPGAVRALVTSVMVGGSGDGRGSADSPSPRRPPPPSLSGAQAPQPLLPQDLWPRGPRVPPHPRPVPRAGPRRSQLTVTSTRRLSGAELTPLWVTHSYSPAWPRWMSEISRISPSEVKPSVEVGKGGGGAGHKHLTRDNTGTTRTHISGAGTAGPECPGPMGDRRDLGWGVGEALGPPARGGAGSEIPA